MPNFTIERVVMTLCAAVLVLMAAFYAGYSKGKHTEQLKQKFAIDTQTVKVAKKEVETKTEVKVAGENQNEKFKELELKFANLTGEFNRLRVRPRCRVSETGTNPGASFGASPTTGPINGPGESEVNLDGVAAKTIELGKDLDKSNIRIEYLQGLVKAYHNACTVQ